MRLYKSWLLPATCTIILVVTTYATTTQAAKQKQAEANLQQVAVSPSRSLKYGDKTTKKTPNQEALFLPTSPATDKYHRRHNANKDLAADKQQVSRNRLRSRIEHTELARNQENVQILRRYDDVVQQNQLDGKYEIPIVQKNHELFNKPILNPNAGQQLTVISNRSRSHTQTQQQQELQMQTPQYSNSYTEFEKDIDKTPVTTTSATNKSRQRKPTTTSRTVSSSHNSNDRAHHPTSRNSAIVRHHSKQRNKIDNNNTNNNIISNTKPLLASTNTFATRGRQSKIESSSNKQTGNNISDNQRASGNCTNTARSIVRKFKSNASSPTITIISSTSSTSPTTTTTTIRPQFQLPNSFNIFTPEFWQFLNPTSSAISRKHVTITPTKAITTTTTTTKKPPKKYKPPTHISTKEEKLSLVKPKSKILPRISTEQLEYDNNPNRNNNNTRTAKKDDGPFRIALPTFNVLNSKRETHDENGVESDKRIVEKESNLREHFDCPRESEVRFQLFPKICKIDEDCRVWNREEICCDIFGAKSCVSGIAKPLEETSHARVIPRKCPSRPLAELWWEVKECDNDMDCWPRVCCPDGRRRYCRTSQPELNTVPVPVQRSFNYLSEYLECTPPPPPIFDLHPKSCKSTLDCFPNVCCQEAGLRHCRPPKKSVLTMLANVFNVDFVKRLTQNIVIK